MNVLKKDIITNCRVTRHLIATRTHEHGSPAEINADSTILTQGVKMGYILVDPKLYLKAPTTHIPSVV